MTDRIKIHLLQHRDLEAVAGIHTIAFPASFITKLGHECVRRYYAWQLDSPDEVYAVGAWMQDRLVGYCFGGVFSMALGGFIKTNKWFILSRLLMNPLVLFHPALIRKLFHGLKLLFKFSIPEGELTRSMQAASKTNFGILAIATDPSAAGTGVGRLLMDDSERYARENDFRRMRLTVSLANENAIRFYEHIGWSKDKGADQWQGGMYKDLDHVH